MVKAFEENTHHKSHFWAHIREDEKGMYLYIYKCITTYYLQSKVDPMLLLFQDHAIDEPMEGRIIVLQLLGS
jgi:hypothetical protein